MQNSQENTRDGALLRQNALKTYLKRIPSELFSCELWNEFQETYFTGLTLYICRATSGFSTIKNEIIISCSKSTVEITEGRRWCSSGVFFLTLSKFRLFPKKLWPFFNNVTGLGHRCFPVNFVKFLKTYIFLKSTSYGCLWKNFNV